MGNIVGEPFKDYVEKQIQKRQEIHGKIEREPQDIVYLNSTLAWVKLASSVSLTEERLDMLKDSYGNKIAKGVTPGKELAMQNVLFNGITNFGSTRLKNEEDLKSDFSSKEFLDFMNSNEKESFNRNGGKQKTTFLGDDGAYGMGGNEFGIVPMPGITSIDSQDLNRGSIKKSRVQIKAYNKQQFDIIDVLYLRLGYTVLLEFGNSHYFDSGVNSDKGSPELKKMGSTLIDKVFFKKDLDYYSLLKKIEEKREQNRGNYDAVLGRIVNFTWSFDKDGTYNINLDIVSVGDVIESLKVNLPPIKAIGDEVNYAQNQALLNILNTRAAEDMTEFYILYPALKKQLKEWWDGFSTGQEITDMRGVNHPHVRFITAGNGKKFGTNPTYSKWINILLTDREIPTPLQDDDNKGFLGVKVPLSRENDALANVNVNNYLQDAVKFAIILQFQGFYAGSSDGFYRYKQGAGASVFGNPLVKITDLIPTGSNPSISTWGALSQLTNPPIRSSNIPTPSDIIGYYQDGRPIYDEHFNGFEVQFKQSLNNSSPKKSNAADNYQQKLLLFELYAYGMNGGIAATVVDGAGNPTYINTPTNLQGQTEEEWASQFIQTGGRLNMLMIKNTAATIGSPRSQITLSRNLQGGFPIFERLVFEYFKKAKAAGGPDDKRTSSSPTFPTYAIELEYEKNKDRVHQWLYLVRKYYTGVTTNHSILYGGTARDPGKVYGPITVNGPTSPLKIGKILNPYNLSTGGGASIGTIMSNLKSWNDFVTYPKYTTTGVGTSSTGNKVDFFVLDKFSKANGGSGKFELDGTGKFKFFVRFGCLLEFLEEQLIPTILPSDKATGRKVPLLKIDTDTKSNICYVIDNAMSTDIQKIIVRNDQFKAIRRGVFRTNKLFEGIDHFIQPGSDFSYGRIMNIYLNFELVQIQLDKAKGKTTDAILFDFIKGICDEINKCLGNVNNLEPVIDHDTNTIKIIDQTPIPGLTEILKSLENEDGTKAYPRFKIKTPTVLQMYGYNGKASNFVHNIGLQTSISKEYASMITIGATANGSVPGMEATAFSRWNIGVLDRIKPEIVDGSINDSSNVSLLTQNTEVISRYVKMINLDDAKNQFRLLGLSQDGSFNKTFMAINQGIVSDYYNFAQAESASSGSLESSVGFLPFNLKIDMDGLSGIKIYNRIHVDTRFLPSNYPETLDFIVTKVNQKVTNNKWDTSLETVATKIIDKMKPTDQINTPLLLNSQLGAAGSSSPSVLPSTTGIVYNAGPNPTVFRNLDNNDHLYNIPQVSKGGKITVDQIVACLHPEVRETFKKFLTRLETETTGWTFYITATYRLFTRSSQFYRKNKGRGAEKYTKCEPNSPAYPGSSPHNYGIGLDVSAKRADTNKTYNFYTNADEWYNECPYVYIGLDESFDWGGDIRGYPDPVHFTALYGDNGKAIDHSATRRNIYSVLGKTRDTFRNETFPSVISKPSVEADLFFLYKARAATVLARGGGITTYTSSLYTETYDPSYTLGGGTKYIENFQDNGTTYVLPTARKGMYDTIPLQYK